MTQANESASRPFESTPRETRRRELRSLLEQAKDSVVIKERGKDFHIIKTEDYLFFLTSERRPYDYNIRYFADRYHPAIQTDAVRESLYDVIRKTLGQHIRNEMLRSAEIVTGGWADGFHIDKLLEHLIDMTLVRGADYTANNFYECVEKSTVDMRFITMIDGVKVENAIDISPGISLVPIPKDSRDLPPYILVPPDINYSGYLGGTIVIIDELVSPVFAQPLDGSSTDLLGPFERSNASVEHPDFCVKDFCEALSLCVNHVVREVSWWSYIDPGQAYAVNPLRNTPSYAPGRILESKPSVEINESDVQDALSLYVARKNLKQKVARKLRVPIDRWMKSKTDEDRVDTFINLGTAFESLYLGDINIQGEIGFKLSVRAAWFLGCDKHERVALKRDFSRIYSFRSKAVHTGILEESDIPPGFMERAQDLCLKTIIKIILSGKFPDWNQLVLGVGNAT